MSNFETSYQPLPYQDNGEEHAEHRDQEVGIMIHVVPEKSKSRWNHIHDLDTFFSRIYKYHQLHGFLCSCLRSGFGLSQIVFIVLFSLLLFYCVDYSILFYNNPIIIPYFPTYNVTRNAKVTLSDAFIPAGQCMQSFHWFTILFLIIVAIFFCFRVISLINDFGWNYEMKAFFNTALNIDENEVDNITWNEVQRRMQEVQREQQMCIHKQELTELDIYHRILRYKNYMVAMMNKNLLPVRYRVPFLGDYVYLTSGLKLNLEFILFRGPCAPMDNWRLKDDYKKTSKRVELAKALERQITWMAIGNLILSPGIFIIQLLYMFFSYAESLRREPGTLGTRRWSIYGRLYLRHFNELDHELNLRLNRAYNWASKYMSSFTSYIMAIISLNIQFYAGSILIVFFILTMVDEDFLQVEHVITIMTVLTMIIAICRAFIQKENSSPCYEALMCKILTQTHYLPDSWRGKAHTAAVRDEFAQLFSYRMTSLIEEMLSPILSPLILYFYFRPKALDIIDFYRNFTIEVVGVGDVCSFALMDVKKHGHPQWLINEPMVAKEQFDQAENGKTELSLIHFSFANPKWKPPANSEAYINQLYEYVQRNPGTLPYVPEELQMFSSLNTMSSLENPGLRNFESLYPKFSSQYQYDEANEPGPSTAGSCNMQYNSSSMTRGTMHRIGGTTEATATNRLLSSLSPSQFTNSAYLPQQNLLYNEMTETEMASGVMSVSALYLHEIHQRQSRNFRYSDRVDAGTRSQREGPITMGPTMSRIAESVQSEDNNREDQPLLDSKIAKSS